MWRGTVSSERGSELRAWPCRSPSETRPGPCSAAGINRDQTPLSAPTGSGRCLVLSLNRYHLQLAHCCFCHGWSNVPENPHPCPTGPYLWVWSVVVIWGQDQCWLVQCSVSLLLHGLSFWSVFWVQKGATGAVREALPSSSSLWRAGPVHYTLVFLRAQSSEKRQECHFIAFGGSPMDKTPSLIPRWQNICRLKL